MFLQIFQQILNLSHFGKFYDKSTNPKLNSLGSLRWRTHDPDGIHLLSFSCKLNNQGTSLSKFFYLQLVFDLHPHCLALREKCPYSEIFWFVFSRIRIECGELRSIFPQSVQMRENRDKKNSELDTFHAVQIKLIRD